MTSEFSNEEFLFDSEPDVRGILIYDYPLKLIDAPPKSVVVDIIDRVGAYVKPSPAKNIRQPKRGIDLSPDERSIAKLVFEVAKKFEIANRAFAEQKNRPDWRKVQWIFDIDETTSFDINDETSDGRTFIEQYGVSPWDFFKWSPDYPHNSSVPYRVLNSAILSPFWNCTRLRAMIISCLKRCTTSYQRLVAGRRNCAGNQEAICETFGRYTFTARDIEGLHDEQELRKALQRELGDGTWSARGVGWLLRRLTQRPYRGVTLVSSKNTKGYKEYRLVGAADEVFAQDVPAAFSESGQNTGPWSEISGREPL